MPKRRKPSSRRRTSTRTSRSSTLKRYLWRAALLVLIAVAGALTWFIWPFWQLSGQFGAHPQKQPSRLYGRSPVLHRGAVTSPQDLEARLDAAGYAKLTGSLHPGSYRRADRIVEIYRRSFLTKNGPAGGDRLRVTFGGGRIESLELAGRRVRSALLDPPLIASYYGSDLRERRPFGSIDTELNEDLILAVLAIEDSNFLSHTGVSLTGTLRAAWNNLREGRVRQGGSTLTQQLVKNIYLSPERTFTRKAREAVLAVMLELRYDKRAIFRAYLNEIYWGRSGSVNLMGVGAASWAYFGKQPAHLTLAEAALLAGMIQSPAHYSPISSLERSRQRRNQVLERLAQLNWIERPRLEAASREPVTIRRGPLIARRAPYFADAMTEEARQRFGVEELRDGGYVLLSTLDERDQRAAEEAVDWGLEALENGWEKGRGKTLQAAVVSVDPRDGDILAYVGGRDYAASQFDRVSQARRQPGSAFKPVVYAAALRELAATPATIFEDEPYEIEFDGRRWSPQNSDGLYHGPVSVRTALEKSHNVPTAKLALRTGLAPIIELAREMGIAGRIRPFPALALGSMEVAPRELAAVYATLATGGVKPPLHGLTSIFDRQGKKVDGAPLPEQRRVLDEDVAFLVNHMLMGVLDRGTGRGAREQGIEDPLAGKTGTTNSRRDSWFAGYAPNRATLVWVGYDDNSKTRLSGARAALPIWSRFTYSVRPAGGYPGFASTAGVVGAWIDPATGGLATDRCPNVQAEFFLRDFAPRHLCAEHGGRRARPLQQPEGIEIERQRKKHPFDGLFRRLGRKKQDGTR